MKTQKERDKLVDEMKELITPGIKSIEDIKQVKERGAEILKGLVDDDILRDCLKFTQNQKGEDKIRVVLSCLYDEIENDYGHAETAKYKMDKGTELYIQYNVTLKWMNRIKEILNDLELPYNYETCK